MDTSKIEGMIGKIYAIKSRAEDINTKIVSLQQEEKQLESEYNGLFATNQEWKPAYQLPQQGDLVLTVGSSGAEKELEYSVFNYDNNPKNLLDFWTKINLPKDN